jgi:hypothetical protein
MKRVVGVILAIVIIFGFIIVRCSTITNPKLAVIARDPSWLPLVLLDKQNSMTAFTDELLTAIASEEGVRIEILRGNADTLFQKLDEHYYNGIVTSLGTTPQNAHRYLV